MIERNRLSRKVLIRSIKIFVLVLLVIITSLAFPYTYSRYESQKETIIGTKVAYYLLDTDYINNSINVLNLVPSDNPYIYEFSIANFNTTERTEVNLEYNLSLVTTTNLPLQYELYMNEDYNNPLSTDIFVENTTAADADGTYFKTYTTNIEYFNYLYNEENEYTLLIYFPLQYRGYEYQDIIESVELIIESKQLLD